MRRSALLLDGQNRCALGIVRALAARGVGCYVGSTEPWAMAAYSRGCRGRFVYRRYADDPDGAAVQVLEKLVQWLPTVVIPVGDDGWRLAYAIAQRLPAGVTLAPSPGPEGFELTHDKGRLGLEAEQLGVAMPRTWLPDGWDELLARARDLSYPVLLKPRRGTAGRGIQQIDGPRALEDGSVVRTEPLPLVQEWIDGDDFTVSLLANGGEVLGACTYRTLRSHPAPFGAAVASVTIEDSEIGETASRLVAGLSYTGIANLDFRRSREDGRLFLLDFNARFGGTTEIALASGVDLAWMLFCLALDEPFESHPAQVEALEFRWVFFGDILHFIHSRDLGGALRALTSWHRVRTNASARDPLPVIVQVVSGLRRRV